MHSTHWKCAVSTSFIIHIKKNGVSHLLLLHTETIIILCAVFTIMVLLGALLLLVKYDPVRLPEIVVVVHG